MKCYVLLLCIVAWPALALAEDLSPIAPAEAAQQIGKPEVVVEMVVKKAKDRLVRRGIIYLDSEEDFESDKNLGVALSAAAAAQFKADGVVDPASHFLGKTLRVRGCIMRFEDRLYLPVLDHAQITIVEQK